MRSAIGTASVLAAALGFGAVGLGAQVVKAPRYGDTSVEAPTQQLNLPPLPPAITPNGVVVEDVVARVNDQIISRSDVERAEEELEQEAASQNLPASELAQKQRDLLREMIDKQLLLSKAKELGLNADADVIRQLDEIRKQNHLNSMDDLAKAAQQQGVNFEDFKAQIRNQILTQQVVRDEVGRHLQMNEGDEKTYYESHLSDFTQPEQVKLSEILVPLPETATAAEIAQAETKANGLKSQIMQGADFAALAKKDSGGPTAAQGGELGNFQRGTLAKVLEDQTFDLKVGETTQPIRTRQGFVILKVTGHQAAGPAPMKDVEPKIEEALYMQQMAPALRAYLTKLREESYVDVQPGFVDTGASTNETRPVFTAYAPPVEKVKKKKNPSRFERTSGRGAVKTVIASPDTTGTRTLTGAEAQGAVDPHTGLAVISAPAKPGKPGKKVRREKVRFGQAPRNALPPAPEETAKASAPAPGAVMASGGTGLGGATALGAPAEGTAGESANLDDNALTPKAPVKVKTRFNQSAVEHKEKKEEKLTAKAQTKIIEKPSPLTPQEQATAKEQAAPLGLHGDEEKKTKKVKAKKVKGAPKAPKERLEEQKKTAAAAPAQPAPTASPSLAPTAGIGSGLPGGRTAPSDASRAPDTGAATGTQTAPKADRTTLPPVTTPEQGQPQQGATTPQQNPTAPASPPP